MSGVGFSELIILFLIGLIVLGPERLPRVANQLGSWIGQARRMTRVMRRQLEDELDFEKDLTIRPSGNSITPLDLDAFSPMHSDETKKDAAADVEIGTAEPENESIDEGSTEKDA